MVLSCNELCELTIEGDEAGLCALNERQFVDEVCQPLALFLPADVEAPECILQGFAAHVDF